MRGNPSNVERRSLLENCQGSGVTLPGCVTWLRRQRRRGRRQEKRYLPQRITQEKHQLSRVMLPGKVGTQGSRVARGGPWRRLETEGQKISALGRTSPGASVPGEQLGYPAPSSGRSPAADPWRGASLAPSPPNPFGQLQGASTPGTFLDRSLSPPSAATCQPPASTTGFPGATPRQLLRRWGPGRGGARRRATACGKERQQHCACAAVSV